ncbi:MAG: F0F1 ATP synthase subunit B [Opitutaceae bacterium]|nr:F0F1 ATP synthase subunit B [Opitutaceae bacterium]
MLSPLLVLAAATTHAVEAGHGETASGITKITQDFGISVPFILAQILSFSIVAFILWKFAFKPVMATLDERQHKIASGLKYAEDMQAKLAATQQETAAILKKANVEASRIIDEARKSAKDFLDRQTQEATARANDVLTKAQQAIELEHRKMLADARNEIARLVVTTTERVLAKKLNDADRASYNEAAARELSSV